jgi:hypothetical protein
MRKTGLLLTLFGLLGILSFAPTAANAQATRTWVSGVGDDANPCSRTAPCKTFAGAISKTFIGGEIDVLDDGGFGTLTITKSITIDGGGHLASTLASGTNGFNISIAENPNDPNRRVLLRNLSINGTGAFGAVGTNTGLTGINVNTNGAEELHLENVRIFNFTQHGIKVAPGPGAPALMDMTFDNVFVADNNMNGLDIRLPDGSHQVNALVRNSVFKGHHATGGPTGEVGIGISADTGAHVWLTGDTVFGNDIGLKTFARQGSPGVIDSFCDNQIGGNTDNGTAPNLLCPQPPPPPAPQIITNTVVAPYQCVVPALKGLPVSFARSLLGVAECSLGKVTKKRTRRRSRVGKILSQGQKPGTTLPEGTKIKVTVGKR